MSESILKALMQLFAIIARPDGDEGNRRHLVIEFLKQQLNQELVDEYLIIFDNYYHKQKKRKTHTSRKGLSAGSVRVITICTLINKELTLRQKIIVVIRLLEFVDSGESASVQEMEFINMVAEIFHIPDTDYKEIQQFVLDSINFVPENENFLIIDNKENCKKELVRHLYSSSVNGPIIVYRNTNANMYAFVYHGTQEMYLNGLLIHKDKVYILSTGSSIRDAKRHPVYYSDIVGVYNADKMGTRIVFEAKDLIYRFKNGAFGIHETNFVEESGKLVGIMGASGSGKSTMLNVLNGSIKPTSGKVIINGIDIHENSNATEGLIGHVSQDDLLMEDLTVFQNIYFNAKLCFSNYSKRKIFRLVIDVLKDLGLYKIKDMKVGSPLNKKISGGQRKRLNIALELIREPGVLFLDEPTSGLSSADSEHILDLLKELTLKGKLIFVVIHQPSSDIFKMFDRLIILDQGGYFIYDGDPVDSITYFKSKIKQADWSASECPTCGNVNPEQVFNIIESHMLDEYGNITPTRKTLPSEWYKYYNENAVEQKIENEKKLPPISFKIPNKIKQALIFAQREILSKLVNKQYMIINLLEAPLLALMLSFIIKYYNVQNGDISYSLLNNGNLPVYIFMAIIVSIFMGMTMSANEIIKDRKILKRESFLNLSKTSYLTSKIGILLIIAAYQAISFTFVGNFILEIKDMYWEYWLVLFTSWSFSILLGLNISDGFKTTVTIYIVIPFLLIPQIILSGVIVKYDELNPSITEPGTIPWFGEIITARWAYEALAVEHFTNNKYEKPIFNEERMQKHINYKKDVWLNELEKIVNSYERNNNKKDKKEQLKKQLRVLRNELKKEINKLTQVKTKINIENLYLDKIKKEDIKKIRKYFENLTNYYKISFKYHESKQKKIIAKLTETDSLKKIHRQYKKDYTNERLEIFVTNKEQQAIVEYDGQLYQKNNMIYKYPDTFLKAHFYAPKKLLFGKYYNTLYVNVGVIWAYTIMLYITLYFSLLQKALNFFNYIKTGKSKRNT